MRRKLNLESLAGQKCAESESEPLANPLSERAGRLSSDCGGWDRV